uniref:AlNc14C261G9809 protein n=1 Tax=Albugo laibachii Nc14 TaxID=890382 RepID=F0WCQ0_9STRA|nr:AlNc14C60G4431 [Albugo laibachii Nc14]CCA24830.1 AlNc14C261G9809 [Albugo laibachii Nc14]|eukprot:CCA24830.1 AlNc14C261G9809 [Albugo laibachii Nc14]
MVPVPPAYSLSFLMNHDMTSALGDKTEHLASPPCIVENPMACIINPDRTLRNYTSTISPNARTPSEIRRCINHSRVNVWNHMASDNARSLSDSRFLKPHRFSRSRCSLRKRTTRYLSEEDRRDIIRRIRNGELQCVLAKEYSVSRAAVCNLYKKCKNMFLDDSSSSYGTSVCHHSPHHEGDVHSVHKYDPTSKTTNAFDQSPSFGHSDYSSGPKVFQMAQHSRPIHNLFHGIKNNVTDKATFRHNTDRLATLLMEEALAMVPKCTYSRPLLNKFSDSNVCGLSIGENSGTLFVRTMSTLYPSAQTGKVLCWKHSNGDKIFGQSKNVLCTLTDIRNTTCFLFAMSCDDGEDLYISIRHLVDDLHVYPSDIHIVVIHSSTSGAVRLLAAFPDVTIICAAIDSDLDDRNQSGSFLSKYWES